MLHVCDQLWVSIMQDEHIYDIECCPMCKKYSPIQKNMKKHPVQKLLDSQGIRTFSYQGRDGRSVKCLGAYCTLGGLLRSVSSASSFFNGSDLSLFLTDIAGAATHSGRLFYWSNIKFVELESENNTSIHHD